MTASASNNNSVRSPGTQPRSVYTFNQPQNHHPGSGNQQKKLQPSSLSAQLQKTTSSQQPSSLAGSINRVNQQRSPSDFLKSLAVDPSPTTAPIPPASPSSLRSSVLSTHRAIDAHYALPSSQPKEQNPNRGHHRSNTSGQISTPATTPVATPVPTPSPSQNHSSNNTSHSPSHQLLPSPSTSHQPNIPPSTLLPPPLPPPPDDANSESSDIPPPPTPSRSESNYQFNPTALNQPPQISGMNINVNIDANNHAPIPMFTPSNMQSSRSHAPSTSETTDFEPSHDHPPLFESNLAPVTDLQFNTSSPNPGNKSNPNHPLPEPEWPMSPISPLPGVAVQSSQVCSVILLLIELFSFALLCPPSLPCESTRCTRFHEIQPSLFFSIFSFSSFSNQLLAFSITTIQ